MALSRPAALITTPSSGATTRFGGLAGSTLPGVAGSLIRVGSELYSSGKQEDALDMLDTAYSVIRAPSMEVCAVASKVLQMSSQSLLLASSSDRRNGLKQQQDRALHDFPPDLYQEDECDVGPRLLRTPVHSDGVQPTEDITLLECIILFDKGLISHVNSKLDDAKELYQAVVRTVQNYLRIGVACTKLHETGMRVHNNLGHICYKEGRVGIARAHFEASLMFGRPLAGASDHYRLEFASVLSNWGRVQWTTGDCTDDLHGIVCEVLRLRSSILRWDHRDVAAAHYNVAVVEYARRRGDAAVSHLQRYLRAAAAAAPSRTANSSTATAVNSETDDAAAAASRKDGRGEQFVLDPVPALIYILLVQNEDKEDGMSQDLVRGLRTLQDKREEQGPKSAEVAAVLNFVGTLLFHKGDLDHALSFFQEELRLEESPTGWFREDVSVSVTCNNIARILQELGKFHDAIDYYQRALRVEYGDITSQSFRNSDGKGLRGRTNPTATGSAAKDSANLYSTVWYNLGLIHDKLGTYGDAIRAFKMSLELRKQMLGDSHPDIACLAFNIGVLQMETKLLSEATESFREALRIRRLGSSTGQLSDRHVVKTLEKLAALHKSAGDIKAAKDAWNEILYIQEHSDDYDPACRLKNTGITLRSVSELYHATGDFQQALAMALGSVHKLKSVAQMHYQRLLPSVPAEDCTEFIAVVEQLASSLLLVGSLRHEMCEPIQALAVFQETAAMIQTVAARCCQMPPTVDLRSLREVTLMLATSHCAPEA